MLRKIQVLKSLSLALGLSCLMLPGPARAIDQFSDFEWAILPDYCKAAILTSYYASAAPADYVMPEAQMTQLKSYAAQTLGIEGPHHYCHGVAEMERNKRRLKPNYSTAMDEFGYSLQHSGRGSQSYSMISALLGKAQFESGSKADAARTWKRAIQIQPTSKYSYLAFAEALRSERRYKEALEILLVYDKQKIEPAADAEYFLGTTYFDLQMYDEAKVHADKAYELGYPFPALREKLKRLEQKR